MGLVPSFGVVSWISIGVAVLTFISAWVGYRKMEAGWERNVVITVGIIIFICSIFMAYWSEKERRGNNKIIAGLQEKTEGTVFIGQHISEKSLPDGKYEVEYSLIPKGKNIVPILKFQCQSTNEAKILNITIKGNNVPIFTEYGASEDNTTRLSVIRNFEPEILSVKIITDKKPELFCQWDPRQR